MEFCLVYVTTGSLEEAQDIARTVVNERLAACANIIPGMRSCYWWEGQVQEDSEIVLLLKTPALLVAPLTERIKALHSYTVPCIVALPITGGNQDFLNWIAAETRA